jgi:hypothetical protein
MFALYGNHPQRAEAEQVGCQVIERFLRDMASWRENYRSAGADDTASREEFSQEVARRLGIIRLSPNAEGESRAASARTLHPLVGSLDGDK